MNINDRQTTEDYILGDVLPYIDEIEEHNFDHSVRLLKKPANSGFSELTFLRSMADSDLINQLGVNHRKFQERGAFVIVRGARRDRHASDRIFGTEEQRKVSAVPCNGESLQPML
ncbi:hypothetical protein PO124_07525 [Bacillus licheniformis]|nr:hypothetical protein [Bacillus licheniformis]